MQLKKKILLIVPDVNVGGVGRVISNISEYLAVHYEFTICVFDLSNSFYMVKGTLVDLKIPNGSNPVAFLFNQIRRYYKVKRLKRKENFDISISFISSADYVNCLSKGNERVILSLRNPYDQDYLHRNFHKYLKSTKIATIIKNLVFRRADYIIPNSRRGLLDIEEIVPFKRANIKFDSIQNFVDTRKIAFETTEPLEEEIGQIFKKNKILLNVSRLYEQKGIDLLLSIYKAVRTASLKLIIIGDGNLRSELIKYSEDLHLKTYNVWEGGILNDSYDVFFLGVQQNPYKFMRNATLFVFPTRFEGFPNTIIEAMACGLPVLCSDCISGPREILCPETDLRKTSRIAETGLGGVLLPMLANSKSELMNTWVDEINRLISNDTARSIMSKEAYKRSDDFSKERIFSKWLQLIEEAV